MRFFVFIYGKRCGKRFLLSKDKYGRCQIVLTRNDFSLEETVFLELKNIEGEWYVRETGNYKINKEQFFQMEKQEAEQKVFYRLSEGREYILTFRERKICMKFICCRYGWTIYEKYELKPCKIIKQKNKAIAVLTGKEAEWMKGVEFLYEKNQWVLKNVSVERVYINESLVEGSQKLNYGDILYFLGRVFLFLEKYIAIEKAEGDLDICYLEKTGRNVYEVLEKVNRGSNECYHRAPRIMESLESEPIKIEGPPVFDEQERQSVFMDIGAAINMMLPMLGMNLFLIYGMKVNQEQAGLYLYSGLFMALLSGVCSISWIIISRKYEERDRRKRRSKKKGVYKKYLDKKNMLIKEQYEKTYKVLQSRYLSVNTYIDSALIFLYLWNRNPYHEDFLKHRIGVGNLPFPVKIEVPEEGMGEGEDKLWQGARRIKEHYTILHQVPILLDIKKYNQIGLIEGSGDAGMAIIRNLILQIALCNCYTEVKIVCAYDKDRINQYGQWDFCRWLPHIWDGDKKKRFIAQNQAEARELFYNLHQVFKERESGTLEQSEEKLPHYILFIAREQYLEGEMFSKYIFNKENYGLTVIWIVSRRERLPNTCKLVLENSEEFTGWYEIQSHSQRKESISFDYIEKKAADKLVRTISGTRVAEIEERRGIPDVIDFLQMYGVNTVEELNIENRWEKNRTYDSCRVLIGKKAGGESCYLDVHERYHGPHGLLAGTTGSGKSEVLQTFILSMIINFSPEAVNFLLVDYKGEGMSGLFSELPHISGRISNLSEGQAYRAMISIKSENRRRQKLFKKCKVNNINDYTRLFIQGSVTEAIPHLLIIIDEFAELKKAEPEFMQELISVAQVGRSLGVHLILATQKPGGVVDDKIWSNSRFRICLKVQEREDSMDMLHNMDACQITQTGRGYLQVGNNEVYDLFQAGWSGAPYQEKTKRKVAQIVRVDGSYYFAEDIYGKKKFKNNEETMHNKKSVSNGESEHNKEPVNNERFMYNKKFVSNKKNVRNKGLMNNEEQIQFKLEKQMTQLEAIKKYVVEYAKKKSYREGKKLWMDPLPQYLYLETIIKRRKQDTRNIQNVYHIKDTDTCHIRAAYNPENACQKEEIIYLDNNENNYLSICAGLFDDPENQKQPEFYLSLMESGHIGICGRSVSGKSTFLQTFIFSLLSQYSKEDVNLYLLDCNAGGMGIYDFMPQVQQEVREEEEEQIDLLFQTIEEELKRRKKELSGGTFKQYKGQYRDREKIEEKKELPLILIVLDGFTEFSEATYQKYEENLHQILREGEKVGILMVMTVDSFSSMCISMRLSEFFKTKICFYMKETYSYTEALNVMQIPVLPKQGIPGRGIAFYGERILEFQTALAVEEKNDYKRHEKIKEVLKNKRSLYFNNT